MLSEWLHASVMDEQQRINLELMRELDARGVEFAFPSRTVYVVSQDPRPERDGIAASRPPADGDTHAVNPP